jgi:hypothetical protein
MPADATAREGEALIKLPDNPKDRKKVIAALCLGGLVVFYLALTFGLQPYLAGKRARKDRVAELEDSIWRAQKEMDSVARNMEQNKLLVKELLRISEIEGFILRPSLGNYLLVANGILGKAAEGLRISLDSVSEIPQAVPSGPDKPETAAKPSPDAARLSTYTVNLALTGGMHALVQFVNRLESGNPYIAITRLEVLEQGKTDPENHVVRIHVQWPVWVDNDHPRRLEAEQIADEESQ